MSNFSKLVERAMHETPPRRKNSPKENDRFALSWWMENSEKTKKAPKRIMHPSLGEGTVVSLNEQIAQIDWDRLSSWTKHDGKIQINEARKIIILDEDKYYNERDFAEEYKMTKNIDMTAADYEALFEEGNAPSPRDTVLTSTDKFKSGSEKPLSGLEGEKGTMPMPKPHEEKGAAPKDAPGTPDVDSMDDEPSRKASVKKTTGGNKSSNKGSTDQEEDSPEEETKESVSSFSDLDLEGVMETGSNPDSMYYDDVDECNDETRVTESHPEGTIAGTPEFMKKLLSAVSSADLDEEDIGTVIDAIVATCDADEDRTLDVPDIGKVMSKMKELSQSGDGEPSGEETPDEESPEEESYSPGDGEPAGPEAGAEHEGETKLFADGKSKKTDDEEADEDIGDGNQKLDEAWLAGIPSFGPRQIPKKQANTKDGLEIDEEDAELLDIKRLSGL